MTRFALLAMLTVGLLVTLAGCGSSSSPPGPGSLGDDCSSSDDCASGFCKGDVCSECAADSDCAQDETCVDDTDGAGYYVCQSSLGALGDACADGAECQSGFCMGEVCSECEADSDCQGAQTCVDDTGGVGWFVCQGGQGALGEACADGTECESGFCNSQICSECEADSDCQGAQTCEDDTAGVGWFICQGGQGALGDACADGTECGSGFCNSQLCSECEADTDCGANEACVDDTAGLGWFVCQEQTLAALGDACAAGDECASGFCNSQICSECEADGDCDANETCVDDTAGLGWFVCQEEILGALGDACNDGAECQSGFCRNNACSECEGNGDCGVQQRCTFDPDAGYAACVGTGDLGDSCDSGDQCVSGACAGGVCSECAVDADCSGGGTCVDDTDGVGWFICTGGLGDDCADPADCASGICNNDICSECQANGDCEVQQECAWDQGAGYFTCQGTGNTGDSCDFGGQCVSGFCAGGVCSECEADADCGQGGVCVDDTAGDGWWVCVAGLGGTCNGPGDCASGYCFNPPGPGAWICSECEQDSDCGDQQACELDNDLGWATCVGAGALGQDCTGPEQCASGFCTADVCSECGVDGDCPGGGTCEDGTDDVGYFYCLGGLGEDCQTGADCVSGFCWNPPFPGNNICSECEVDGDCGAQQACEYDIGDGYASCVGAGDLGDSCSTGDECRSGICNTGVCSDCQSDADCGEGGTCVDDTGGVGYFVCAGGLGDACQDGAECDSGFCYDLPGPLQAVCSECESDNDCNGGNCQVDWVAFYAVCN